MKTFCNIFHCLLVGTLSTSAFHAQAATFDAVGCFQGVVSSMLPITSCSESATIEWDKALADAKKYGATPISVLVRTVSFGELPLAATKQDIHAKAQILYAELGTEMWQAGIDESPIDGRVNIHVTSAGLDILKKSNNALSFSFLSGNFGLIARNRSLDGSDANGSDAALRQEIASKGFVDAIVTLNVDSLVYDIRPDGRFTFTVKTGQIQEFETKANQLLQSFLPQEIIDTTAARQTIAQVVSGNVPFDPRITVRVNMQGAVRLGASQDVRALAPKGFISTVPRQFDQSLLTIATGSGTAPTDRKSVV